MQLDRTIATLADAREVYRSQLSRERLFVSTNESPAQKQPVTLRLVIDETGGELELQATVVGAIDADTARNHGLGDTRGVVLHVPVASDEVREPLRALLTGKLRGTSTASSRTAALAAASTDNLSAEVAEFNARTADATHYAVLGVATRASAAEIRKAYLKLIRRFHPDTVFKRVSPETQAELELAYQRVTQAFETLTDARTRDKYDVEIGNLADTEGGTSAQAKQRIAELDAYKRENATGIARARELYQSALDDERTGDLKSARNKLRLAQTFDPRNPIIRRKLDELNPR